MKIIKDLLRSVMLLYKRFLYGIAKLIEKVDERTVIFEAFQGRSVACSPKALYVEMLENEKYEDYILIWALRDASRDDVINTVKFESFEYYRCLARAKYWIFNSNTRPFLKPRANQIFVQTWHGTPLKKIGCDVKASGNALTKLSDIEKIYNGEAKKISYMVSPSDYCTEKFISAFNLKAVNKEDCVLTLGYPRNDFLFKVTDEQCKEIKNKLGILEDKKVILYAPTFRDNKYSAAEGFKVESYIDFDQAKESLGDDYVILFRAHYFISGRINFEKYQGFVYDVSDIEDINELYVISDLLVTDYSSVFFDYANLKRPIVFYMPDLEEYKNQTRDFYFDVNELPGAVVREQCKAFEQIRNLTTKFSVSDEYQQFNKKYNYLDGKDTSKKVLEKIIG